MLKALSKGSALFVAGTIPCGEALYRYLTREVMNTQRGHVGKLYRIWPDVLTALANTWDGDLEGARIWVHEAECTPFLACVNFLVTGAGGYLINTTLTGSRIMQRHLVQSINQSLDLAPKLASVVKVPSERVHQLDSLRWCHDLEDFFSRTRTFYRAQVDFASLPIPDSSVDIVYSGGRLEHYRPGELTKWLSEARRILRPGGLLAPIFDHRDHLYHFDRSIPFLNHLRIPEALYRITHRSRLLYHNRLLPADVISLISQQQFEYRGLRRFALPTKAWFVDGEAVIGDQGIARVALAGRFAGASDEDLKTAAAHYLFRRPVNDRDGGELRDEL